MLNPNIILQGQQLNAIGALSAGQEAGQRQRQTGERNAMQDFMMGNGAAIRAGDEGALNALSNFGLDGLNAAQGVESNRLGMDNTRSTMQDREARLRMAQDQARQQAQVHAANMSAADRAAEAAALERGLAMGTQAQSPEQWDQVMQSLGLTDMVGQFDNKDMIIAGALGVKDALSMGAPDPGTSGMQEYRFAQQQGYQGTFEQWKSSNSPGTNVNVQTGTITPGYQQITDPETGAIRMEPIPGGPVDQAARDAEESRGRQEALTGRQLNPTIDDIATARDLAETGIGTTGTFSKFVKVVPGAGQSAVDMSATIDAIGSGISLENLNQMRQASPTGGALGNVSDKQSGLLAEAFGSLNQNLSRPLFLYNLARVENTLNDIVHGEIGGPERHDMEALRRQLRGQTQPAQPAQPGQSVSQRPMGGEVTPETIATMAPEQINQYIGSVGIENVPDAVLVEIERRLGQ